MSMMMRNQQTVWKTIIHDANLQNIFKTGKFMQEICYKSAGNLNFEAQRSLKTGRIIKQVEAYATSNDTGTHLKYVPAMHRLLFESADYLIVLRESVGILHSND